MTAYGYTSACETMDVTIETMDGLGDGAETRRY